IDLLLARPRTQSLECFSHGASHEVTDQSKDIAMERVTIARTINNLAQDLAEAYQPTQESFHRSFERVRRLRKALATELTETAGEAEAGDIACSLLYLAQELLWMTPAERAEVERDIAARADLQKRALRNARKNRNRAA